MRKGRRETTCKLLLHQFGWELRPLMRAQADVMLTKTCHSQDEVLTTGEQWKTAMLKKAGRRPKLTEIAV